MKVQITPNTLTVTLNLLGGLTVTERILDVNAGNTCFDIKALPSHHVVVYLIHDIW